MANYTDSVLSAANYKLDAMMQLPEFKVKPSAALMAFLENTNFLVPASERERAYQQKASDSQTVSPSKTRRAGTRMPLRQPGSC